MIILIAIAISKSMAAPRRAFSKIRMTGDWAILNRDDPQVWKLAARMRSRVFSFGLSAPPAGAGDLARMPATRFSISAGAAVDFDACEFKLRGDHNSPMRWRRRPLRSRWRSSRRRSSGHWRNSPLPHRIEIVRQRRGVTYIDDSKGTNVGAVVEALAAMSAPVILIAGGVDKGGDYAPLRKPLARKG